MKPQCDSIVAVMLAFCVVASIPAQAEEVIPPAITPNKVISLMEDPDFKDFTVSLNKAQSLTANRQEIGSWRRGNCTSLGKRLLPPYEPKIPRRSLSDGIRLG